MIRAVLLDRDGVLNVSPAPARYVTRPEDLVVPDDVVRALAELARAGFALIVVTNQQGVSQGELTRETLDAIHRRLAERLATGGVVLRDILACTHLATAGCACRKPRPGMLLEAARRHDFSLPETFFVGDAPTDVMAGRAAGARTILISSANAPLEPAPEAIVGSLGEAVRIIVDASTTTGARPGIVHVLP